MNRRKAVRVTLGVVGAAILLAIIVGAVAVWRLATDVNSVTETLWTDPDATINDYFSDLGSGLTDAQVVEKWIDEGALLDHVFGPGAWHRVDEATGAAARAEVRPLLVKWVQRHRTVCQGGSRGPVVIVSNGVNAVGLPEATGTTTVTSAGATTTLFIDAQMDDSGPLGVWKAFDIGEGSASLVSFLRQSYESGGRPADFVAFLNNAASPAPQPR